MSIQESNNFFENIYKSSCRDEKKIPWATLDTNKYLAEYLEQHRGEGRAIVIGCGLGHDALALEDAGFDVTAIDISATAITWCKDEYDYTNIDFKVQDIFELPQAMLGEYDFVFEALTIQSLPLEYRDRIIGAIASLMAPNAKLLAVADGKNEGDKYEGPPWPLEHNELRLFQNHGCEELEFSIFEGTRSTLKFRAVFKKC